MPDPAVPQSHGDGAWSPAELGGLGAGTIIETGVLLFNPACIRIGAGVYIGHRTSINGYWREGITISDGAWIGPDCHLHAAGGIRIGRRVGLGSGVKILTSSHDIDGGHAMILDAPLQFAAVVIGDGADLGCGAIILPGVTIGDGAQIGAGAVVTQSVPALAVAVGNPARILRLRQVGRP